LEQRLAQGAQARAGIEDDDVVPDAHFHARGVAAITNGIASRCGNGAANAPELDGGATFDRNTLTQSPGKIKLKNMRFAFFAPARLAARRRQEQFELRTGAVSPLRALKPSR
jgi:hypothetical protein